jgi:hypothetical protein
MERGQAYTLEAFIAATILVASLLFALQVSAVDPLAGSTATEQVSTQQAAAVNGVLAAGHENGTLRPTLLYWDNSTGQFHDSGGDAYDSGPPTPFGETLNETLGDRGYAYNVNLYHLTEEGRRNRTRLVYQGTPSARAVVASRAVTLADDDVLYNASVNSTDITLREAAPRFYATDTAPAPNGGGVFNIVEVEVVAWRG